MRRRAFFPALAAVLAAPSILAKLRPAPTLSYEEMPLGLIECMTSGPDEVYWSQGVQDDMEAKLASSSVHELRTTSIPWPTTGFTDRHGRTWEHAIGGVQIDGEWEFHLGPVWQS
jgi:hypothetical protein